MHRNLLGILLILAADVEATGEPASDPAGKMTWSFAAEWENPACQNLLTNLQVDLGAIPGNRFGLIGTNTVAFQKYALETTVTELARVSRQLRFPMTPNPTCADVTLFRVTPSYFGLRCSVRVNNRFALTIDRNGINRFSDLDFFLAALESRPDHLDALLAQPDALTKGTAERLARDVLKALGLENGKNIQLREPPYVMQWETDTGPMPFYKVQWKEKGFLGPNDGLNGTSIAMEICGISSNVSHFFINDLPSNREALRLPYATNFFQLLGMSETNQFRRTEWRSEHE